MINNFYSNEQIDAILSSPPKNIKGVSTLDLNLNKLNEMPIEKKERKSPLDRKKKKTDDA